MVRIFRCCLFVENADTDFCKNICGGRLAERIGEEAPDLIIFGALGIGILGCGWINKVLIPKVHVLRLGLEGMERRKWRLALLEAEVTRSLKLDCGVGKHVVPLAGKHPRCVWIISWLPGVRISLAVVVFGAFLWLFLLSI